MMVARDHHLNRPGRYLRRSDERAETYGCNEGEALGLQHRQQMNRERRRDH